MADTDNSMEAPESSSCKEILKISAEATQNWCILRKKRFGGFCEMFRNCKVIFRRVFFLSFWTDLYAILHGVESCSPYVRNGEFGRGSKRSCKNEKLTNAFFLSLLTPAPVFIRSMTDC